MRYESIVEFFKNLPARTCIKCGDDIEEQYESYALDCHRCINRDEEN